MGLTRKQRDEKTLKWLKGCDGVVQVFDITWPPAVTLSIIRLEEAGKIKRIDDGSNYPIVTFEIAEENNS